jgi:hypothetical protein
MGRHCLDCSGLKKGDVTGAREGGNELSGSTECRELF